MNTIRIKPPKLHQAQHRLFKSRKRFNVAVWGRRAGKTTFGKYLMLDDTCPTLPIAWFMPSYKDMLEVWREVADMLGRITTRRNASERRIELLTGGVVEFWSLDNPNAGRGRKYRRIIIDEAALVPNLLHIFNFAIRPTLVDYHGDAFIFSTPKGRNDLWKMYQFGLDKNMPDWYCQQLPTTANPFIDDAEIEAIRKTAPERVFAQEYLAQFIDDAGGVFRGVMDAATAVAHDEAQENAQYVAGVDIGTMNDYTVICVIDIETNQLVAMDRFSNIAYDTLYARVQAINERFMPTSFIVERNAIGQPVIEQLAGLGLPVQGFTTTNTTKAQIIQGLQAAFEHKTIAILNDPILIGELQAFEAKRTASGLMKYEAPSGMHDDTVMALALAWHGSGISWGAW